MIQSELKVKDDKCGFEMQMVGDYLEISEELAGLITAYMLNFSKPESTDGQISLSEIVKHLTPLFCVVYEMANNEDFIRKLSSSESIYVDKDVLEMIKGLDKSPNET